MEVLRPVIAGGVERFVDALPRSVRGLLEKNARVAPLVGGLRVSAEMGGDGGKQFVCALSWARDVDDDRGERHESRS
jgi:hypothetical protein